MSVPPPLDRTRKFRWMTLRNGKLMFLQHQPQSRQMSYIETFVRYKTTTQNQGVVTGRLKIQTPGRYGFTS